MEYRMTKKQAKQATGGLGFPSKMPGTSYGTSAEHCQTGAKLAKVPGTVCYGCYALKANYQYPSVKAAHANRENAMRSLSEGWIAAMAFSIAAGALRTGTPHHRWFDSGDVQSVAMLEAIAEIARRTPGIHHWLPTKEYRYVREYLARNEKPANLTIRVSGYKVDAGAPSWPIDAGLTVSSVASDTPAAGAFDCPSRFQENKCGDCRACWDDSVKHVSYHLH